MGSIRELNITIDRDQAKFDLQVRYSLAPAFGGQELFYISSWSTRLTEIGGPVARVFSGSSQIDSPSTGIIPLGLDPTPVVRSYSLSFEATEDTSDNDDYVDLFWEVQSAAYFTTSVTLEGVGSRGPYNPGEPANDILIGGSAADTLRGLGGDDLLDGGGGADMLVGGLGNDSYQVDNRSDVVVELANQGIDTIRTTLFGVTLGANVENLVFMGPGNARSTGNALANVLTGGNGTDILDGLDSADTLNGGAGNDVLIGGLGADKLNGGTGVDTADYEASAVPIAVYLATGIAWGGTAAGDTLTGIENVRGSAFADIINGDAAANMLTGNGGNDNMRGGDNNDVLIGGAGDDLLVGEAGQDRLTGGEGADTFLFNAGFGRDIITDFAVGPGSTDIIRIAGGLPLRSFEAVMAAAQATGVGGADTIIRFDANTSITLLGVDRASLEASDFFFV